VALFLLKGNILSYLLPLTGQRKTCSRNESSKNYGWIRASSGKMVSIRNCRFVGWNDKMSKRRAFPIFHFIISLKTFSTEESNSKTKTGDRFEIEAYRQTFR
jgi:hypothetical protein